MGSWEGHTRHQRGGYRNRYRHLADDGAHEDETLGGQAISTRCVGASSPLGA
jgi:hypothetical protein